MLLKDVTKLLNDLRIPTSLVFTPVNLEQERKRFFNSDVYNPVFKYKIVANENKRIFRELSSLSEVVDVDPRISDFYVDLINEKKEADLLMNSVGNNDVFTDLSVKRYGRPSSLLFRNACRVVRRKVKKYKLLDTDKTLKSRWIGYDEIKKASEVVLKELGLSDWSVEVSKKIAKNGVKIGIKTKMMYVDEGIKKRVLNLRKTLVHEIGTHAFRAINGLATGFDALGKPNLPDYLDIEEGLALWNEEYMGVLSFGQLKKRALMTISVHLGMNMSFRDLYSMLLSHVNKSDAFDIAYRVKRGLSDTSLPGIYTKDIVYYRGFRKVRRALEKDGSLYRKLYAGKISLREVEWVDEGLIRKPDIYLEKDKFEKAFKKACI